MSHEKVVEGLTTSHGNTHFVHEVTFSDLTKLTNQAVTRLGFTAKPTTKVVLLFERPEPLVKEKEKEKAADGDGDASGVSGEDEEEEGPVEARGKFFLFFL